MESSHPSNQIVKIISGKTKNINEKMDCIPITTSKKREEEERKKSQTTRPI